MTDDDPTVDDTVRSVPTKVFDYRVLIGFVLVLAIFGLLAFRTEANSYHISHEQRIQNLHTWEDCTANARFADQLNGFLRGMSKLEETNSAVTVDLRKARIALYSGLILASPRCGPKP